MFIMRRAERTESLSPGQDLYGCTTSWFQEDAKHFSPYSDPQTMNERIPSSYVRVLEYGMYPHTAHDGMNKGNASAKSFCQSELGVLVVVVLREIWGRT